MADQNEFKDEQEQVGRDERVDRIAAGIAALIAKGEEVVAALEEQADAATVSFNKKAADTDARMNDFAAAMQAHVEKATSQFMRDLEVISSVVDGRENGAGPDAEAQDDAEQEASKETSAEQACASSDATRADPVGEPSAEPVATTPYQPQFTPGARALRERMRVGAGSDLMLTDPEFVERFANFAFDDVPSDTDLPDRTRFMCWLATLLGCQGIDEFRALLPAALNVGVEPEAVKEIVYQATAYLGIGRVYPFLKATNDVLMAAGVQLPLKSQAKTKPTQESRYEMGEKAQVACFGEHMHGYKDRGAADYPHINQWLVKNCFGDWYTRAGLTIAERELMTFCFLAAQGGCEAQLKAHTAGNLQCGNDRAFLIKVVSSNVPFIGYPRTLNALAVVEEVTAAK